MSTLPDAVRHVKDKLFSLIPEQQALEICRSVGHSWRERTLNPAITASLFLTQVLDGNPAVGQVRRKSKRDFTESAYCQARGRLPLAFFERLANADATYLRLFDPPRGGELWLGHRVFLVRAITIVTTLLNADKYPRRKLAKLYEARWRAEGNLRHLKQTLGMDVLRCKSYAGVRKELFVYVLAYNLVRRVMLEAARNQGVEADRVSFVDALRWYRGSAPGEVVPRLNVNPERPGRFEPRARKRRPKPYDLLNRPRAERKERLEKQRNSA